jgi:hypothetical protein
MLYKQKIKKVLSHAAQRSFLYFPSFLFSYEKNPRVYAIRALFACSNQSRHDSTVPFVEGAARMRECCFLHPSITKNMKDRERREGNLRNLHDSHSCFFICKKNNFFLRPENHDNSIANAIFAQRIILKRPKSISGCFSTSFSFQTLMLLAVFLIDDE